MDDLGEAKALIEQIRRAKQVDLVDGENENASDLENALKMLSEELYSTPTHFILELIQNADDNKYHAGTVPKLTMLYHELGYLWIGCNEVGFTASNVRAICRIHNSTKKVEDSKKGYIGDKGIGFKSVFTVADKVWIKSGALSFVFDTKKPLGMIAPEWADLPSPELVQERTVICLQIPKPADRLTVKQGLQELKPELVVFLRQLRSISVEIRASTNSLDSGISIRREESHVDGIRLTALEHVNKVPTSTVKAERLLVFQRTVARMPVEDKRPGVTETEILMAFPIDENHKAVVKNQDTFAFLPVRSYGLPFLLQADFILNAPRENILLGREWNTSLVNAAIDLFMSCVDAFNHTGLLKYAWPQYARSQGTSSGSVFNNFYTRLGDRIKLCKVLESRASTLEAPPTLQMMPAAFTDENDKPLIMKTGGAKMYASPLYSKDDMTALGVREMTSGNFCKLLEEYAIHNATGFHSRPDAWHSKVAEVLVRIGAANVRHINLIPLRGGKWVSGNNKPFFFADLDGSLMVPRGINIAMIASEAARDWARRKLYAELGAQNLDVSKVYQIIVEQHNKSGQALSRWMVDDVISHALFLFNAPSKPSFCDISGLLVAAEGTPSSRPGRELYMDVPGAPVRVSDLLGACADVKFISQRYLVCVSAEHTARWLSWLQKELEVNTLPRLRDLKQNPPITREFRWLVDKKQPSSTWLVLLRDHWDHYSVDLARYQDLSFERLSKVAPILAVSDPEHHNWIKLSALGLTANPTTRLYLDILSYLSGPQLSVFTPEDVKRIYTALRLRSTGDVETIKKAFRAANATLVFIPLPAPGRWISLDQARWNSPPCLSSVTPLRNTYPDLQPFFVRTLGVKDTTVEDVVSRLVDCRGRREQYNEIKSLLDYLSRSLATPKVPVSQTVIDRLLGSDVRILPVRMSAKETELRSASDQSWFYADTTRLREGFGGKLGLLDFDMIGSSIMMPLVKALGLQGRKLSNHAIEETVATGEQTLQPTLIDSLKAKAKYIQLLVPEQARVTTLARLTSLEVYSAESLLLKRRVELKGGAIYGEGGFGQIAKTEKDGKLMVHVSQALVRKGSLPPKFLVNWLSDIFAVPSDKQQHLKEILETDDDADIEEMLEKEGLMMEAPPPELVDAQNEDDAIVVCEDEPSALSFGEVNDDTSFANPLARKTRAPPVLPRSRFAQQSEPVSRRPDRGTSLVRGLANGHAIKTNGTSRDKGHIKTNGVSIFGGEGHSARSDLAVDREHIRAFEMESMHSALPRKASPDSGVVACGGRLALSNGGGLDLDEDEGDPHQLENGSQGELFVYKLLTAQLGAPAECWTSDVRTQHGLPKFRDFEAFYTDFTVDDRDTCDRITQWLLNAGHIEAKRYAGKDITYRIEVKTTNGKREEPFSMSINQYNQARQCHISDSNVYVILRVYNVTGTAGVCAYVDPHGQELERKLSFEPVKYRVQPYR
ncbi:hypothetical protein B0A55_10316 [Friedmanniomyces simplex]|uniref:Uncharacterized protein n=1 Tax=Friedmanniomyces simplex TaxID=329884 RepID=A0A4U0WLW3_9PEZI|nr:hypothetical protein B0A55_10316 [Friedmanniomyces simplex]